MSISKLFTIYNITTGLFIILLLERSCVSLKYFYQRTIMSSCVLFVYFDLFCEMIIIFQKGHLLKMSSSLVWEIIGKNSAFILKKRNLKHPFNTVS